jgi:hypothetical protein
VGPYWEAIELGQLHPRTISKLKKEEEKTNKFKLF